MEMCVFIVNLFVNIRTFVVGFCEKYDFLLANLLANLLVSTISCARDAFLAGENSCVPA